MNAYLMCRWPHKSQFLLELEIPCNVGDSWSGPVRTSPDQTQSVSQNASESTGSRHGAPIIDIMSRRGVSVINSCFYWRLLYQLVRTSPDQIQSISQNALELIGRRHGDPVIDIMSRREVTVINSYFYWR